MIEVATIFLGVLLAQASPGPNMMAVASASLGINRRAGILTAVGIASGVFIWGFLLSPIIDAFLNTFPETLVVLRLVGGGYLLFLGIKSLKRAFKSNAYDASTDDIPDMDSSSFLRGFLVVMTNPKAAMMWVAVILSLTTFSFSTLQLLAFSLGASASAMIIYGLYALLFSTGIALRTYAKFFRVIESAFGFIFGAIGGRFVLDGLNDLRN